MDDLKRGRLSFNREGDNIRVTVDKGADIEWSVLIPNDATTEDIKEASQRLIDTMTGGVPFDFIMGCYKVLGKI